MPSRPMRGEPTDGIQPNVVREVGGARLTLDRDASAVTRDDARPATIVSAEDVVPTKSRFKI